MTKTREITLVFGKTGSGKSYFTRSYIQDFERVVIIDPLHEYEGLIFTNINDLIDFYEYNKPETFRFVCRFENDSEYDYLFEFCNAVGNLLLVVEEAEMYISPYAKSSEFLNLVRYGRHKAISIIGVARRASELSTDFKAMVNRIVSFKQTLPHDLKIMSQLGLENLEQLPDYEYKEVYY